MRVARVAVHFLPAQIWKNPFALRLSLATSRCISLTELALPFTAASSSKVKPIPSRNDATATPCRSSPPAAPGCCRDHLPPDRPRSAAPAARPEPGCRRATYAAHERSLTTTAASPGHFSRRVARRIAPPQRGSLQAPWRACRLGRLCSWRSARTRRLSAASRMRGGRNARRYRHCRAHLHAASAAKADNSSGVPAMIVFLPAKGGLPTIASKPPFSRANTSGNSICQWNGGIGMRRQPSVPRRTARRRQPNRSSRDGFAQSSGTRPARFIRSFGLSA